MNYTNISLSVYHCEIRFEDVHGYNTSPNSSLKVVQISITRRPKACIFINTFYFIYYFYNAIITCFNSSTLKIYNFCNIYKTIYVCYMSTYTLRTHTHTVRRYTQNIVEQPYYIITQSTIAAALSVKSVLPCNGQQYILTTEAHA